MTFNEAKQVKLPFGDFKGRTLDQIAQTDAGLLYLDKLRAWDALWPETKEALNAYLDHEPITRELQALIDKKG